MTRIVYLGLRVLGAICCLFRMVLVLHVTWFLDLHDPGPSPKSHGYSLDRKASNKKEPWEASISNKTYLTAYYGG